MKFTKMIDQTERVVNVPENPQRIISLVPSQTELLFDLGLGSKIIGITKFCVHPSNKCKSKEKVGGTKKLNINKIIQLNPDIIIGNKEENTKEDIEALAARFPVWISDVSTLDDAYGMIKSIGAITGTVEKARALVEDIKVSFTKIVKLPSVNVIYLIWNNPYMAAGEHTFINTLIKETGMKNLIREKRYPVINELTKLKPDVVMLSSEPYPFLEKHRKYLENLLPDAQIILVDGEMFSWYGSRLRRFPDYINSKFTDLRSSQK